MGIFSNINKQLDQPAEHHPLRWWHLPLLLLLIVGTILTCKSAGTPSSSDGYMQSEGEVFGTIYHITYHYGHDLRPSIDSVLAQVDRSLSPFNSHSIITAVNNNQDVTVDSGFTTVFRLARQVYEETGGAFDITVAPLVNLWGFGFKNEAGVTDSLVRATLIHVGMDKVSLQADRVVKTDTLTMLDCSAIAKGYGVDAVGLYLEHLGITDYMVEIGGEVRLRGSNPKGEPWSIGIMKPVDDPTGQQSELEQVLRLTGMSMATSGNYRNYYEREGRKYAHTIDPHTGYPVQHSLLSATVLASDCATADAYATSFMVLGMDRAREVLSRHPELSAFLIYSDHDGNTHNWMTDGFKKYIRE